MTILNKIEFSGESINDLANDKDTCNKYGIKESAWTNDRSHINSLNMDIPNESDNLLDIINPILQKYPNIQYKFI